MRASGGSCVEAQTPRDHAALFPGDSRASLAAASLAMSTPLHADTNTSWGGNLRGLGHNNYLGKILNARVYEVARETPLFAPLLSAQLGNNILLKREDLQPVFAQDRRVQQDRGAAARSWTRALWRARRETMRRASPCQPRTSAATP